MMASPAYDDCFHCGRAVVEMMPIHPPRARKYPRSWKPELAISYLL
uniref:Uncharacterized protein n=1 Tax=Anguilla anguilla TaxID=7936 RepID=A0A0E9TYK0_ANGAN